MTRVWHHGWPVLVLGGCLALALAGFREMVG